MPMQGRTQRAIMKIEERDGAAHEDVGTSSKGTARTSDV